MPAAHCTSSRRAPLQSRASVVLLLNPCIPVRLVLTSNVCDVMILAILWPCEAAAIVKLSAEVQRPHRVSLFARSLCRNCQRTPAIAELDKNITKARRCSTQHTIYKGNAMFIRMETIFAPPSKLVCLTATFVRKMRRSEPDSMPQRHTARGSAELSHATPE